MPRRRCSDRLPASLPAAVYEGNPPNCIRVNVRDVSGLVRVGPGILHEGDDFKHIEFHPGFKGRLCSSPMMIKCVIARYKRQLGIEKVVEA